MFHKIISKLVIIFSFLNILSAALPAEIKTLEIGALAPDFRLKNIDGTEYTLQSFETAKILVIIFTANHCPTAQAYEDRIIELNRNYREKNVQIIAVSSNNPAALRLDEMGYTDLGDTFEDMQIRAKDKGFSFPYLYDGDSQEMAKTYGAVATPHVFIFDKTRTLRYTGRIDDAENIAKVTSSETRDAIEALLQDKSVSVTVTKSFGCSIKWAEKETGVKNAEERWQQESVHLEKIDVDGIQNLIENDSGKLRLINVWATWCGPCVAEFPELIKINRMYRNRDFEMITISADSPDKEQQVLTFLEKNHSAVKNYLFHSENKYALIEAVDREWPGGIPYTIIVKPGGEILFKHLGIIDPLEVKRTIVGYLGRYYH